MEKFTKHEGRRNDTGSASSFPDIVTISFYQKVITSNQTIITKIHCLCGFLTAESGVRLPYRLLRTRFFKRVFCCYITKVIKKVIRSIQYCDYLFALFKLFENPQCCQESPSFFLLFFGFYDKIFP